MLADYTQLHTFDELERADMATRQELYHRGTTTLPPPRRLPARACANATAVVERGVPLPLTGEGSHLHIDAIQLALEAIHEAVSDAWFVAGQSVLERAGSV